MLPTKMRDLRCFSFASSTRSPLLTRGGLSFSGQQSLQWDRLKRQPRLLYSPCRHRLCAETRIFKHLKPFAPYPPQLGHHPVTDTWE